MNSVTVRDNPGLNRYEILEDDRPLGFSEYQLHGDVISFVHTQIDPAVGGRGLGRQLVEFELNDARTRGLTVHPLCPYVRKVIADSPEAYLSLVPESQRSRFGLPSAD